MVAARESEPMSETAPARGDEADAIVELRRIDPSRNMRRFYRLAITPDLFGGFLFLKQWGRIGLRGRIVAERYDTQASALDALQRQALRKQRRGYR
jgi:predicted DNA-binding WGR domain protein